MPRSKPAEEKAMLLTCSTTLHAYFKTRLKARVSLLVINFQADFALIGERQMRRC